VSSELLGYGILHKRVTIFVLFSFSFVCSLCFSSVNIFKVKLVVRFCHLSVISDSCELYFRDMGYLPILF
jgi:hypothetical protein